MRQFGSSNGVSVRATASDRLDVADLTVEKLTKIEAFTMDAMRLVHIIKTKLAKIFFFNVSTNDQRVVYTIDDGIASSPAKLIKPDIT